MLMLCGVNIAKATQNRYVNVVHSASDQVTIFMFSISSLQMELGDQC